MAFDQTTRNRLARFVGEARSLLTEEFTRQLQHEYGLDPTSGEVTPLGRLTALDDARRETARILRETLDYYLAGKDDTVKARQEGLGRLLREQAFTVLNRLCALRMAEARGLLIESVGRGYQSKGFQLYARLAGPALGEAGAAYRSYVFSLFDEFALDLPVLFDRFSPQGRLFPRETALLRLLALLDDPEIEALWAEDETIGWIYQYFNSREERQAMRAESSAPRNSRELAVRNQFFTPRYVVEFLTDNTLGRIWYEMTKGKTVLKETCRYLVRRPREVFFGGGPFNYQSFPTWVRQIMAQGDFLAMPNQPSIDEIGYFALLINGYPLAESLGYGDVREFGARWMQSKELSLPLPADVLDLWLILFAYQRLYIREGFYDRPEAEDSTQQNIRIVYNTLRQGLQHPPEDLSQEELLRRPVFIPYRPLKDPREIKMLDPACGSMHFGLYAFDLFETIYEEAWYRGMIPPEDFGYREKAVLLVDTVRLNPSLPVISHYNSEQVAFEEAWVAKASRDDPGDDVSESYLYIIDNRTRFRAPFAWRIPLRDFDFQAARQKGWVKDQWAEKWVRKACCFDFEELPAVSREQAYAEYLRQTPRMIIENNLHGIDIDPRAVQIAGLSLWLRAQKSWQAQRLKPGERPQIRKSNIVCAEPMPGDKAMLEEFLSTLHADRLDDLMRKALHLPVGQKVRATKTMADALAYLVRTVWQVMELAGEAGSLLKIEETLREAIAAARLAAEEKAPLFQVLEYGMKEPSRGQDVQIFAKEEDFFWDQAEALVLEALQEYTEQVNNRGDYRLRLFIDDAFQGFAFIDLCRKHYDLLLMNPPFGDPTQPSKTYFRKSYIGQPTDLYACFLERFVDLSDLVGTITSRSFLTFGSFYNLRNLVILPKAIIQILADFGLGVMDSAMVRSAAYVLDTTKNKGGYSIFLRLLNEVEKNKYLAYLLQKINSLQEDINVFIVVFVNRKTYHFNHEKPPTWAF
jgi:hypothetical protein